MSREEQKQMTAELSGTRRQEKGAKRARVGGMTKAVVPNRPSGPKQEGWAALDEAADVKKALTEFKGFLTKRSFAPSTVLFAIHGISKDRYYADRINGVYFQMAADLEGHSCYQRILHVPALPHAVSAD